MPRYFTSDEANALIPTLTNLLRKLQDNRQELQRKDEELGRIVAQQAQGNGHRAIEQRDVQLKRAEQEAIIQEITEIMDQIHALGGELKDIDVGLVDFYTLRKGREVYLCWRLGEEKITYWHDLHSGYAGRQPL